MESFLNFSRLAQLLSVGGFLGPLGAFKRNRARCLAVLVCMIGAECTFKSASSQSSPTEKVSSVRLHSWGASLAYVDKK